MPSARRIVIATILLLPTCSLAQSTDSSSDEAQIHAIFDELTEATEERDAGRVASLYLPDSDIWIAGQPLISGIDAIRRNEEEFFALPGFQSWRITSIGEIRFIDPDVALVNVEDMTTLADAEVPGAATLVVVRRSSGWRIAAVRVMQFDPPQP